MSKILDSYGILDFYLSTVIIQYIAKFLIC